jgi:stringent starvation protein B
MPRSISPFQPYLLRAAYDWLADNNLLVHLEIDASSPLVIIPRQYIDTPDSVVLNISPSAISKLTINNNAIEFDARFGGKIYSVIIPHAFVLALYNPEPVCGIGFRPSISFFGDIENFLCTQNDTATLIRKDAAASLPPPSQKPAKADASTPKHLKLIKNTNHSKQVDD